jgi:hypothetical protein
MRQTDSQERLTAAAAGIAFAYAVVAVSFLIRGAWISDPQGAPVVTDFLPVFLAGKLALAGHAAVAYDPIAFHPVQARFVGHPFAGFLGWHYPPIYFAVAIVLALLPYAAAFLIWVMATVAGFAGVTYAITRRVAPIAFMLALPPVLGCVLVGQNGFFTAALLGAMLLCLQPRPILAGLLLTALTFKPQFGILLPFALLAGGYWRSLGIAALLTAAWVGIGYVLWPELFQSFLHYLPQTNQAVVEQGTTGWRKLQSVYAVVRLAGGSDVLGWAVQGAMIVALLAACVFLWRGRFSFALKAAGLSACALLATPYIYFYDLPVLAVPLAFLLRDRDFDRTEWIIVAAMFAALGIYPFVQGPWGFAASLLVLAMVARRAVSGWRTDTSNLPALA